MASDESCRRDDEAALRLKMVAFAAILAASVAGVFIPLALCRGRALLRWRFLSPDGRGFAVAKAFAAGVILATGFVHMLTDAAESLTDPSLPKYPWSKFPFSGFTAMVAALATLVLDVLGTRFYERKHGVVPSSQSKGQATAAAAADGGGSSSEDMHIVGIHAQAASHGRGHAKEEDEEAEHYSHVRHIVLSPILELGIVSHSVIIGLSLGVSQNPCTITPLLTALSFHQFFEGFALGGCISQAKFDALKEILMALFFCVTTPGGIAIGLAVASSYNPDSPTALAVEGILDSISAGILIYMALVDLIATDFLGHQKTNSPRLQVISYVALFLGAGFMSLLALWA